MSKIPTSIRLAFTAETKPANPAFKWGFFVIILGLLVFQIFWRATLPEKYPHDPNTGFVAPSMLFFNHIAYQFQWSNSITRATLRLAAWLVIIIGLAYMFLIGPSIYPLSPGT